MTVGIYSLYWEKQDLVYIGKSIDLESRKRQHLNSLLNNKHTNFKVQEAFTKYGYPEFIVLEVCNSSKLKELEVQWTAEFEALNSLGIVDPEVGLGDIGENNPSARHTKLQYLLVFRQLLSTKRLKIREICLNTGVSDNVVNSILYGKKHRWLKDKYPFLYSLMISRNSTRNTDANNRVHATFKHEDGTIAYVTNLSEFSREFGLTPAAVSRVYRGERVQHKGWRLLTNAVPIPLP